MKSILEGRPALKAEIDKIAEVAGYLWQNGWAERNGGNITVNITEYADDDMHRLPAISEVKQIGITLPALRNPLLTTETSPFTPPSERSLVVLTVMNRPPLTIILPLP